MKVHCQISASYSSVNKHTSFYSKFSQLFDNLKSILHVGYFYTFISGVACSTFEKDEIQLGRSEQGANVTYRTLHNTFLTRMLAVIYMWVVRFVSFSGLPYQYNMQTRIK